MTPEQNLKLHNFFVCAYNNLMNLEEDYLRKHCAGDLSVREIHVLNAVKVLSTEEKNTMAAVARFLSVSPGSLTTAVNTLVNKNYLERSYTPKDRRVVYVHLTAAGEEACRIHDLYHRDMMDDIGRGLNETELDLLTAAIEKVCDFAQAKAEEKAEK